MGLNNGNLIFPLLEALGGTGAAGDAIFPLLVAEGYGGFEGALEFPLMEVSGSGHNITAVGELTLPLLQALGSGTPGEIGDGAMVLPLLLSNGQGYSQTVGVGGLVFPLLLSGGAGHTSIIGIATTGDGAMGFPLLTSVGVGLSGTIGEGAATFPLLLISGAELPNSVGAGALIFPLIQADGYGRVVAITLNRKAIVMHLFSHAVTEYKNFNFNSLAHFKEHFLGANENGLFILGGKDDLGVPIEADIRTGIHDLASDGVIKLPKEAWIGYRTDGQLELDIEVDENKAPYPYFFDKTSQRITEARTTLGKGLKERFYTFVLKNLSGSDFDLQSLRILGNAIGRKRR